MNTQKIKQFLQSLAVVPLLAVMPVTGIVTTPVANVVLSQSAAQSSAITTPQDQVSKDEAAKIDAVFASRNSPLAGYGMTFVSEAQKNGINPYLLPAIMLRESSGINSCQNTQKAPNNFAGWASCRSGFDSIQDSIARISAALGGKNPNITAYAAGMTDTQILRIYNPPTAVYKYPQQVVTIMKMIDNTTPNTATLALK